MKKSKKKDDLSANKPSQKACVYLDGKQIYQSSTNTQKKIKNQKIVFDGKVIFHQENHD